MKETVYVAFYIAPGDWTDKSIRLYTHSHVSHCEIAISDAQTAIDGTYFCMSSSHRDKGTRAKRIDMHDGKWGLIDLTNHPVACHDIAIIRQRFKRIINAGYDYRGVFRFLLPIFGGNANKYFCSELCAELLGLPQPETYTPIDLYNRLKGTYYD